ncbi:MAG TPA: hypothetical protein VGF99_15895 [Myxococcota bacterium]
MRPAVVAVVVAAIVIFGGGCLTERVLVRDDDGTVVADDRVVDAARITTERRRGLPFTRTVPLEVLGADELGAWLNRYYDPAKASLKKRDRFFHKLGILPPDVDTASTYRGFVGAFAGGIYDEDRVGSDGVKGTMILVHDYAWWSQLQFNLFGYVTGVDYAYETFLVHELTHALQDQHLHLDLLLDSAGNDDVRLVQKIVLESEANVIGMSHFAGIDLRHAVPRTLFFAFLEWNSFFNRPVTAAASSVAPSFFARQSFSQYELGLSFVGERLAAGEGTPDGALGELSRAYTRVPGTAGALPESTEQLLFAQKQGAHRDRPLTLSPLPVDDDRRWRGHRVLSSGTFGALALKHWLEGTQVFGVDTAVDGWGGDRYELLVDDRGGIDDDDAPTVLVWRLLGDTDDDAIELLRAMRDRLRSAYGNDRFTIARDDDDAFVATIAVAADERRAIRTARPEHLALVRRGRAFVVVNGLDAALPLDEVVDTLLAEAVPVTVDVVADARRAAVAADLETTLATTLAQQRQTSPSLHQQLLMPARTIRLRAGAVGVVDDGVRNTDLVPGLRTGFDAEARWGVRPFLEVGAWPVSATLHHTVGPLSAGLGISPRLLPLNNLFSGTWSATALGTVLYTSGDLGIAAQLAIMPTTPAAAVSRTTLTTTARLGVLLRPTSWLVLQPGLEVARDTAVDRADIADERVRLGGALQRGFVDAPLIELELLSGLRAYASWSTSWRLRDPGTSAVDVDRVIEHRALLGALIDF